MLFVLTGDIQTGKTRWLEGLLADLGREGVETCGVLAPGVWADRRQDPASFPHADANGFEKLGIDNVLLPDGVRITFARRADLASDEGLFDPNSQSAKANLAWCINEEAIECVNGHFASLRKESGKSCGQACGPASAFLVVDELGRLELERGGGLTEAVAMLEDGPGEGLAHALIVVREALLPAVIGRFGAWGEMVCVHPDDASREMIAEAVS